MADSSSRVTLLINLGSPDDPSPESVGRYLREFLMDARVIDLPWPLRWFLVNILIVPRRKFASAHAYQTVWTSEGAPLIVTSERVRTLVEKNLNSPVHLAMRYGRPSITSALERIARLHASCSEIVAVPLYPHFAMSSFETCTAAVEEAAANLDLKIPIRFTPPFFEDPGYIEAMVKATRAALQAPFDHLLFSFHGVPLRHLRKSDPSRRHCLGAPDCCATASGRILDACYRAQTIRTCEAFARAAGISGERWSLAYQSRFGRDEWIQPYTEDVLREFPKRGIRRLVVMSPAFVADCLETIEELGVRGKELFLEAGGESFTLAPCLNDHPAWIEALAAICARGANA